MGPMERKVSMLILLAFGLLAAFIVVVAGSSSKTKKPEPTDDITPITTPNGKKGVYCRGMSSNSGPPDRTKCYRFVSTVCPAGYDFVRENDDAVMVECKPEGF